MARGAAFAGGGARLRRVLRDLAAGGAPLVSATAGGKTSSKAAAPGGPRRPVKLAVLGGSISWGSAVSGGVDDWFTLVTARLRDAFPNATVVGRNGCVPATPSSFMNMCLEQYLDDDVDLVFLEYATNDGWDITNDARKWVAAGGGVCVRTYERLLRKVMGRPRSPAVVLVQLPTVGQAFGEGNPARGGFARTVEDVYGAFAAYYDTPYISFRNAIWRLAAHHQFRMNFTDYYGDNYDFIHPLVTGHRAIADLVLYSLQRFAVGLALSPWSDWDAQEAALPLPDPMFEGNFEERNRLCANGEAFASAVSSHDGWELVNEGDDLKQKWGFVSRDPGAELVIELNTTRQAQPERPTINVQLAYLKSYAGMGRAEVACGNGCGCGRSEVDAHHGLHQSTIYLMRLEPTQAPRCQIRVRVLEATSSPDAGHKFKVTGVMANEFVGNGTDDAEGALNNEEWLGVINKAVNATITTDKIRRAPKPPSRPNFAPVTAELTEERKPGGGAAPHLHHRPHQHHHFAPSAAAGPTLPPGGDAGAAAARRQQTEAGGDDA
ncbi:MAG: SGNH hydrolase-type esterase domain-containing protein [Monoraphidium minutum]|nr:MAG: SGNH hydrolase-type esterase domain-containing protein [Monoraphidium minutum]